MFLSFIKQKRKTFACFSLFYSFVNWVKFEDKLITNKSQINRLWTMYHIQFVCYKTCSDNNVSCHRKNNQRHNMQPRAETPTKWNCGSRICLRMMTWKDDACLDLMSGLDPQGQIWLHVCNRMYKLALDNPTSETTLGFALMSLMGGTVKHGWNQP